MSHFSFCTDKNRCGKWSVFIDKALISMHVKSCPFLLWIQANSIGFQSNRKWSVYVNVNQWSFNKMKLLKVPFFLLSYAMPSTAINNNQSLFVQSGSTFRVNLVASTALFLSVFNIFLHHRLALKKGLKIKSHLRANSKAWHDGVATLSKYLKNNWDYKTNSFC